jgi:5-methylcytosine-specific restriction endonuclease McrA
MKFKKGFTPWNKGKSPSKETKEKISKSLKGKVSWNKGKPAPWTSERNKITNRTRTREKHPMWKGGVSKIDKSIREMPEYKVWRTSCFERDNWTCQTCHNRGYVTVHHIKSFSSILKQYEIKTTLMAVDCDELWDTKNGVTLCEECHKLTDNYKGRNKGK